MSPTSSGGYESIATVCLRILRVLQPALVVLALGIITAANPGGAEPMRQAAPASQKLDRIAGSTDSQLLSPPGPWGQLEVIRISTEPPDDYVAERYRFESAEWYFPDYTRERIVALFQAAGLDKSRQEALWKGAQQNLLSNGWTFHPDAELLLSLTPASRKVIYLALAKYEQNVYKFDPFRWRAAALDEWFVNGGLSDATVSMIRRLLYYRGQSALFADPELVLATIPNAADRVQTLKTLARQSTLMVRLKIQPDADISALMAYWGRHRMSRDIRALLESLAKVPDGCTLDIIHLLPRFARTRLYSYPIRTKGMIDRLYDCHWSSMNFWNDPPDDRMEETQYRLQVLERDYSRIREPYVFGDLLFLMAGGEEVIHSVVYIADNIVFTKNGTSITSPWILMKLDRLLAYYETEQDVEIMAYRWKQREEFDRP